MRVKKRKLITTDPINQNNTIKILLLFLVSVYQKDCYYLNGDNN